jgi:hypothetical protein
LDRFGERWVEVSRVRISGVVVQRLLKSLEVIKLDQNVPHMGHGIFDLDRLARLLSESLTEFFGEMGSHAMIIPKGTRS